MNRPAGTNPLTRILAWRREHRTAATVVVVASAFVLVAVAAGLAWWTLARQMPTVGTGPSPSAASEASAPTLEPSALPADSPSPTATTTPPATPSRPTPPPLVLADFAPLPPMWGQVVVNALNVRSGPGADDPIIGVLNEGDLVLMLETDERAQILADGVAGFVSFGPHEDPWVRAVVTPVSWTGLRGIATNGSGYLAYGTKADLDHPPYEGGFERPLFMRSDDGITWQETHEGVPGAVTAVAGGPGGWVALAHHSYGGASVSHSVDGDAWTDHEGLGGSQHVVAHGGSGWVIIGSDYDGGMYSRRSADGRTWDDPISLPGDGSQPELEASEAGYIAFDRYNPTVLASVDGVTWRRIEVPADRSAWIADVELIGRDVLIVTVDPDGGAATIYRGRLGSDATLSWSAPADPSPFDGYRIDSIASGANGLIALGWHADRLVPVAWTSTDGGSWRRVDLATETFGGMIGREPAWGAGGWVAQGMDAAGVTLWRSTDGATWEPTGHPERVEPAEPPCPAADNATVLALMFLGDHAYECFGDASLTVRGWVPAVEGLGGCCWPEPQPDWLAGPYPAGWITAGEVDRLSLGIYVPAGVSASALEAHRWVEVVGHFGDPAAATCRHVPLASYSHRLTSQEAVRDACMRRFVVESVTLVSGP